MDLSRLIRGPVIDFDNDVGYLEQRENQWGHKRGLTPRRTSHGCVDWNKHYSYTLWVNIYQNGEVSYVLHTNGEKGQRVIILPEAEVYDDEEVNKALSEFVDHAKAEMKSVFGND